MIWVAVGMLPVVFLGALAVAVGSDKKAKVKNLRLFVAGWVLMGLGIAIYIAVVIYYNLTSN